jgi:hypothetical protein
LFLIAGFGLGVVIGAYFWLGVYPRNQMSQPQGYWPIGVNLNDPSRPLLDGGIRVSVEEAAARSGIAVYRPQASLASDDSLSEVWLGTANVPEIGLRYESGLRAYLSVWPAGKKPADFYGRFVAESGVGWTTTINGHPALVIPANAQGDGFPPTTVVDISLGSVEVSLHADVSVEELVAIAATVS